jgi:multidrug resistance protein
MPRQDATPKLTSLHGNPCGSNPQDNRKRKDEVPATSSTAATLTSSKAPIVYRYLEFDTPLPTRSRPPTHHDIETGRDDLPLPTYPDLVPFTSPFAWSPTRKTLTLTLSSAVTMLSAYTAGAYSMPAPDLRRKWDIGPVTFNTGITTWAVGFGAAPMFLAPLSEINGRRPVFIFSGCLMTIALLGCAITESFAGMLIARFFAGVGSSTFATMVGGVVSDIYHTEDRNTPMAIYSGAALFGTGLGPLVSGFIAEYTLWRWVFYVQVILAGILTTAVIVFFQETRGSVLLSRKARALNKYYDEMEAAGQSEWDVGPLLSTIPETAPSKEAEHERIRWKVLADEQRATIARMLYLSLTTPFHLLFTEPVVFFFSLWVAFAWAILYMSFDSIPLVFSTNHNFTISQTGTVFAAVSIGTLIGTLLSIYQEKLAKRTGWGLKVAKSPEGRLYFACIESALLPVGLFWFGWTAFPWIPPIVPILAIGCAQIGIFSIYLAVFNYLADVYHRYASSALAAQSFCRNILGAVFPLFSEALFRDLGFPRASSLLGAISAVLTVVPFVLILFGPAIRARSKFASEMNKA